MSTTDAVQESVETETSQVPRCYGLVIWGTEEGDLVTLGHHPRRLLVAACSKYLRTQQNTASWSPLEASRERRALAVVEPVERWIRWNPDSEHMPYCEPGTPGAVAITEVPLS